MLKVINEIDCDKVTVEMDDYVPFNVEFGAREPSPPLYWRGGDGALSLIEIGISERTGIIRSITLTSVNSEKIVETKENLVSNFPETKGIVVCDTVDWDKTKSFDSNFKDENVTFHIQVGSDYLSVLFDCTEDVVRYVSNENIRFCISSDNSIVGLDLLSLTSEQIETFKASME